MKTKLNHCPICQNQPQELLNSRDETCRKNGLSRWIVQILCNQVEKKRFHFLHVGFEDDDLETAERKAADLWNKITGKEKADEQQRR